MKNILLIAVFSLLTNAAIAENKAEVSNQQFSNTNKAELKSDEKIENPIMTQEPTEENNKPVENAEDELSQAALEALVAPSPLETSKSPSKGCEKIVTLDDVKEPLVRALFTTKVENREPVDKITEISENIESIVFFTEIKDFKCGFINYTWMRENDIVYSRDFNITSNRYRLSTSVKVAHYKKGDEAVVVIKDANDKEIQKYSIRIK